MFYAGRTLPNTYALVRRTTKCWRRLLSSDSHAVLASCLSQILVLYALGYWLKVCPAAPWS